MCHPPPLRAPSLTFSPPHSSLPFPSIPTLPYLRLFFCCPFSFPLSHCVALPSCFFFCPSSFPFLSLFCSPFLFSISHIRFPTSQHFHSLSTIFFTLPTCFPPVPPISFPRPFPVFPLFVDTVTDDVTDQYVNVRISVFTINWSSLESSDSA